MQDRFLRACRREPVDFTPVWFMRQAGRYQPEYRALREQHSLLELIRRPDLAAQITVLPVRQLKVDAAILFSDIMVPLGPMGVEFSLEPGIGPVVASPIRRSTDVAKLRPIDPSRDLRHVTETVGQVVEELGPVPLIGFAGAPFTLASYLIEGRPTRTYTRVKEFLWTETTAWADLMDRLSAMVLAYLELQVHAGARAVQLFDSWAGQLSSTDYERAVAPWVDHLVGNLAELGVPVILFAVGADHLLERMAATHADVIGVDWRVPINQAMSRAPKAAIQGNLDPAVCLLPEQELLHFADRILDEAAGRPGHIFGLGHGVLPQTPPDRLRRLVEHVHARTVRF